MDPQALAASLVPHVSSTQLLLPARAPHDSHDDNRLYAVVIRAAQKAGDWREAVLLYREAEAANLGPSAATATTVFLACYAEQQVRGIASCLLPVSGCCGRSLFVGA